MFVCVEEPLAAVVVDHWALQRPLLVLLGAERPQQRQGPVLVRLEPVAVVVEEQRL